jgi:lysophospholipase L1-like esterase
LLIGLGDSVTAGFGASPGHSYFKRLVKNPDDEFPDMQGICLSEVLPNLESHNHSLSGTTSLECLDVLIPRFEVQDEETLGIVVLTTGGNDIIHNYGRTPPREGAMYGATVQQARPWIGNFRVRLHKILDEIESRFPAGCHIFLANIYDPTDNVGDAHHAGLPRWKDGLAVIGEYNRVIEDIAAQRENVHLIDMHGEFLGHGIHCVKFWAATYDADDPHYWYYDNLEDPNDRGYDALRRAACRFKDRLLTLPGTLPTLG